MPKSVTPGPGAKREIMSRHIQMALVIGMLALYCSSSFAASADSDGDGVADAHEKVLGTDLTHKDDLRVILDDGLESAKRRAAKGYDPTKDFLTVESAHVAEDRHLWRISFAAAPRPQDTVLHLYVNADANEKTGRPGPPGGSYTGTEYMLTIAAGRAYSTHYDAAGTRSSGPPVTYVVAGKSIFMSADIPLGRDAKGLRYGLYVLCHTTTKDGQRAAMSDSSRPTQVAGMVLSDRKKIIRPRDYAQSHRVDATFGLDLIRAVLTAKDTVAVPCDRLERTGFAIDQFTSHRFAHLKLTEPNGRAWTTAPKTGKVHVGFMMYDDSADDRIAIEIDGVTCGVAVANANNNRTWLYWLREPRTFKGGEQVALRGVGGRGRHGVCTLLFLPRPPPVRTPKYEIANTTASPAFDHGGRVVVSWTTSWPCTSRFMYDRRTKGKTVEAVAESRTPCLVHRVVLNALDYRFDHAGRATAIAPNGTRVSGKRITFRPAAPARSAARPDAVKIPLTVRNPHGFAVRQWPVTMGIPLPRGLHGSWKRFRLTCKGTAVRRQVRVTGYWPDGSARWLLVSFLADVQANAEARYLLEYGHNVRSGFDNVGGLGSGGAGGVSYQTGDLEFFRSRAGHLGNFRRKGTDLALVNTSSATLVRFPNERKYAQLGPRNVTARDDDHGPIRIAERVVSDLTGPKGVSPLRIETRIEAYRDSPFARVHHTFVVKGDAVFTDLAEMAYRVPVPTVGRTWQVPLVDGRIVTIGKGVSAVRQRFDDEYVVVKDGKTTAAKGRLVGAILSSGPNGCAIAVRDAWQNYPIGFSLKGDGVYVELCPPLESGLYDALPFEKEGHHLYYHLLRGRHRLKRGVSKTHELFLCFEPDEKRRRQLCALFQRPLVATAPPEWYCNSGAFYSLAHHDPVRLKLYEQAMARNLAGYAARRERQHDYGALNFGDWYPERGSNWGNVEYDTQHAFFLEFVRSGNANAFFLACQAELHNRDVDTVHWAPEADRIGGVYVHQMCHVGGYYTKSVPGTLGFPSAGCSVSHSWVEGHFDHYFLTGDHRSLQTGRAIADYYIRKDLGRPYDFLVCRTPGWHLIMLMATYAATSDPYYLNAARIIVERVLSTQDGKRPLLAYQAANRKPFQEGGWSRMMRPGHCRCEPRHRGNAGFMVAILLSGLKYYHDVVPDPRVKTAIIRGAHSLLDECYSDKAKGFRYTSCPKTSYRPGASPLMVEGIARAYLWTRDPRFRRVLTEALPRGAGGSSYGKGFSMYYRCAPRVLADILAAGLTLDER